MAKPVVNSSVARRIALNMQQAHLCFARLLRDTALKLSNNDRAGALAVLAELQYLNMQMYAINGLRADGALRDAETASMRLASGEKRD